MGRSLLVVVLVAALGGVARADDVDDLVKQLTTSTDYKDRLIAADLLGEAGDERAIDAFIVALKDEEKTIRGAAAIGLGKVVTSTTSSEDRKRAMKALERASHDKTKFVRKQAKRALEKLKDLENAAAGVSSNQIFLDLGPMVSNLGSTTPSDTDLSAAMEKRVAAMFRHYAEDWLTEVPEDFDTTQGEAYSVDGRVNEVVVQTKNGKTVLSCKVSMRVATYATKSAVGNLSGGAKVAASNVPSDVEDATYECVDAVIENLLLKKLIPAIRGNLISASSATVSGSATVSADSAVAVSAPAATADSAWSPDGWTLLGEDEVDLIDDEVEVDRRKSTWSEVAIVVTGDDVKVDTVELALAGKGRKRQHADLAQTFGEGTQPHIIALAGKRRAIDKVRLTYTKHTLDAKTRVQVWAR